MGLWSAIGGVLYSVGLQTGVINPMCIKGKDENGNEICINPNSPPSATAPPTELPKPFYKQTYFYIIVGVFALVLLIAYSKKSK